MKILFPSIMFALLFVSFLPSVMAQPELFGRDLREEGSWRVDVDIMEEIDAAMRAYFCLGSSFFVTSIEEYHGVHALGKLLDAHPNVVLATRTRRNLYDLHGIFLSARLKS